MDIIFILREAVKFMDMHEALNLRLVCRECTFDHIYLDSPTGIKLFTTLFGQWQLVNYPEDLAVKIKTKEDMDILNALHICLLRQIECIEVEKDFVVENCAAFHFLTFTLNLSNSVIKDLTPLSGSEIMRLKLKNTYISDISFLEGCEELCYLSLNNTKVTNISVIEQLINLDTLKFRKTKCRNFLPLKPLINLVNLDLSYARGFRDASILTDMTELSKLILKGTNIQSIIGLSKLFKLKYLDISSTYVTDLSPIKDLSKLDILKTRCMKREITDFKYANHVRILDVSGTCNDEHILQIATLENLEGLYFMVCEITDISPLLNCKKLSTIVVDEIVNVELLKQLKTLRTIISPTGVYEVEHKE